MNFIISSAMNTAAQDAAATVSRPRSKYARIKATTKPAIALGRLALDENIAGTVITASTAYGT